MGLVVVRTIEEEEPAVWNLYLQLEHAHEEPAMELKPSTLAVKDGVEEYWTKWERVKAKGELVLFSSNASSGLAGFVASSLPRSSLSARSTTL